MGICQEGIKTQIYLDDVNLYGSHAIKRQRHLVKKVIFMDIEKVHPELRERVKRMPAFNLNARPLLFLNRFMLRLTSRAKKMAGGVTMTSHKLENASVNVYTPAGKPNGGALLWIHGGGFVMGTPAMSDRECRHYAATLNIVVVAVGYRLAPKHPFPAALDDCLAAWQWLQASADKLGIDVTRIAVGGESAGGGHAASLCQRLLDAGGVQPVAQLLYYPMLDDRTAAKTELDKVGHFVWDNNSNRFGWTSYLGHAPGLATVAPYAVPARRADLGGLPPTWIGVGELDLFYEENKAYVRRLQEAGVACELYKVPQAPHGFPAVMPEAQLSKDFLAAGVAFLRGWF
jgi:acetyl esterase/lipase